MDFGMKIRRLRYKKDLKQVELARLAGISNTYLSDIESGRADPSLKIFKKLVKVLEADSNWLLSEDTEEHNN